jgi:hypothetical protein
MKNTVDLFFVPAPIVGDVARRCPEAAGRGRPVPHPYSNAEKPFAVWNWSRDCKFFVRRLFLAIFSG